MGVGRVAGVRGEHSVQSWSRLLGPEEWPSQGMEPLLLGAGAGQSHSREGQSLPHMLLRCFASKEKKKLTFALAS